MRPSLAKLSILTLASLAACGTSGTPGTPGTSGTSSRTSLDNTVWRLVELGGRPAVGSDERGAYLEFALDPARVTGSTGCNRLAGPFTQDGATLRFGPAITTRMACTDTAMNEQERAFLAAVADTEHYEIAGDTLTLVGRAGRLARLVATAK